MYIARYDLLSLSWILAKKAPHGHAECKHNNKFKRHKRLQRDVERWDEQDVQRVDDKMLVQLASPPRAGVVDKLLMSVEGLGLGEYFALSEDLGQLWLNACRGRHSGAPRS